MESRNQVSLSPAEALARLSVVSLIQLVGFGATILIVKLGQGWFGAPEAEWQRDCLNIAYIFGGASLVALFVTLICGFLFTLSANVPERVIWVVFAVNTIFFALAMARTGGASCSFFGQLVPIQLSGILVLEHQKAMMTKTQPRAWAFATFSVLIWILAVILPKQVARVLGWEKLVVERSVTHFPVVATTSLFILSVAVMVLAYWLPPRREFVDFIRRHRTD